MPRMTVEQLGNQNPVLKMYDLGFTPLEVKRLFVETLKPYFRDESVLAAIDVGLLGVVAANAGKLSTSPIGERLLELAVGHARNAIAVDSEGSFSVCAFWEPSIVKATSEFWSVLHLELVKDDLPLEEFRVEIFRNIGSMIEACLKPMLGYTLSQIRVGKGVPSPSAEIEGMELGDIVGELHRDFGDKELAAPSPWGVRLNHWRNIAQHHNSFVRDGSIVGIYGKGRGKKEVVLTRGEVLEVARRIGEILTAMNTARVIYMHENAEYLAKYLPVIALREESHLLSFTTAVGTQGFQVDDIELTGTSILVKIRDRMDKPWMERFVHCSQFVLFMWHLFPKAHLELHFASKDGTPHGRVWVEGKDLERVSELRDPFKDLANIVHFEPR